MLRLSQGKCMGCFYRGRETYYSGITKRLRCWSHAGLRQIKDIRKLLNRLSKDSRCLLIAIC